MRVLVLGALVLTLGGCGPTADEIAVTALSAMPLAYAAAVLALSGLHALWRERLGKTSLPGHAIVTIGAMFALLGLGAASSSDFDPDLFPACVLLIGGVAISLTMLAGRIRLASGDPRKVSAVAPAVVVGLVTLPFLVAWIDEGPLEELAVAAGSMFVIGVGMYMATPLILGLLIETVFARARYRRRADASAAVDDPELEDQDAAWMVEERMYEQRLYNRRW